MGTVQCAQCQRPTSAARPTCIYCGALTAPVATVSPRDSDLAQAAFHMQHQRYEAALVAFGRVITADPRSLEGWLGRATAFAAMGRISDASAAADRAFEIAPNDARVTRLLDTLKSHGLPEVPSAVKSRGAQHRDKGDALFAVGKVIDALREYDEALLLDPKDGAAQAGRIACMKRIGGR